MFNLSGGLSVGEQEFAELDGKAEKLGVAVPGRRCSRRTAVRPR
jgi:ribosomal protein L13E